MVVPEPSITPLPSPVESPVVPVPVVVLDGSPEVDVELAPPALLAVTELTLLVVPLVPVVTELVAVVVAAPPVVLVVVVATLLTLELTVFEVTDVLVPVVLVTVVLLTVLEISGDSSVVLEQANSRTSSITENEAQPISKRRRMTAPQKRGALTQQYLQRTATDPDNYSDLAQNGHERGGNSAHDSA